MTPQDVEGAMVQLETQLKRVPSAATVTRIWQPWDQLADISQPAIVIVEPSELEENFPGRQSKLTLFPQLVCYLRVNNQDTAQKPATRLNNFLAEIRQVLLPTGSDVSKNTNTLGGLVSSCYISGRIQKDAGVLDEQASILIPLTIIMP